jgi:hypothetical protein
MDIYIAMVDTRIELVTSDPEDAQEWLDMWVAEYADDDRYYPVPIKVNVPWFGGGTNVGGFRSGAEEYRVVRYKVVERD